MSDCRRAILSFPEFSNPVLYMVVERFHGGNPRPVYERYEARGRMAPEGLRYVGSWVSEDLASCYQVMECEDRTLLDQWMSQWSDLVDFEVIPVLTSAAARDAVSRID